MDTKTDMTYRFIWNKEPSEKQLQALMQEVGDNARRENTRISMQMAENIKSEFLRVKALFQSEKYND